MLCGFNGVWLAKVFEEM